MITWIRAQVAALEEVKAERAELEDFKADQAAALAELIAERDKLTAELATLKAKAVVLPEDWRNQVATTFGFRDGGAELEQAVVGLVESWRGQPDTEPAGPQVGARVRILRGPHGGETATVTETPQQLYPDDPGPRIRVKPSCTSETTTPLVSDVEVIAELPPNDIVYEATRYVTSLVLAARGSWPGWAHPDEVPAAVQEAVREIQRLHAEATRQAEDRRRELVALLRDHPGGGLVHEPGNWEETLNVVRAHLVHRKLDKEFRTNLVQAVSRWVPAGEPVSDWQMLHLVGQLADQAARWFDAATEKPATTTASAPDPAGPVTFIDERGRAQTYTLDQVLDAVKHSDKGDGDNW
jgi:hypothetical protein